MQLLAHFVDGLNRYRQWGPSRITSLCLTAEEEILAKDFNARGTDMEEITDFAMAELEEVVHPNSSPSKLRVFPDSSPRAQSVHPDSSPSKLRVLPESSPRKEAVHPDSGPTEVHVPPDSSH